MHDEKSPPIGIFVNGDAMASRSLIIVRDFKAPRERVWRAWAQPELMIQWYGPKFYRAAEVSADVRVGGAWRACLKSDNAHDVILWQSGRYLVVTPPERLEFTFAWETPGHEDGPGVQTHVVVRFEELANGNTRMHFNQTGFLSEKTEASHSVGWNGTFDRLAEYLLTENVQPST